MQIEGKMVNLAPGMAISVEIKTGTRRLIEYLMSGGQKRDGSIECTGTVIPKLEAARLAWPSRWRAGVPD